jgi:hypothetical protein
VSNVIAFPSAVNSNSSGMESSFHALVGVVHEMVAGMGPEGPVDLDALEDQIDGAVKEVALAAKAVVLRAAEPAAVEVEVNGKRYRRMSSLSRGVYRTVHGPVELDRHLYRQLGVHNGPTLDPIAARCGLVEGRFTPKAARIAAFLAQAVPSREAADICGMAGVLPYSRTTLFRVGQAIGECWEAHSDEIEDELVSAFEIPEEARTVSMAIDRVSMPMAEDREPTARDRDKGIKRPIDVNYRMAYCAVWTLHDAEGEPMHSVRYAHIPEDGSLTIDAQLACDLEVLLDARPSLRLVTLADGAHEMQKMLDRVVPRGREVTQLVDFWHLVEKLAAAAKAVQGTPGPLWHAWKHRLLQDDAAVESIEATLKSWASRYGDEVPEPLHAALTYIDNQRERLRYATARRAGLPIASGSVEATCKTIVTVRFKRTGARWRPAGAQALLGLRALATSSRWTAAVRALVSRLPRDVKVAA